MGELSNASTSVWRHFYNCAGHPSCHSLGIWSLQWQLMKGLSTSILSGEPETIVSSSHHQHIGCDTATTIVKYVIIIFQIFHPMTAFILIYTFFVCPFWCFWLH